MVKIRIKDKFVIVENAIWKVFDQFEVFLNSMSVTLTRKFYSKIQKFILFKQEKKKNNLEAMSEENKIQMLMPSKNRLGDEEGNEELSHIHMNKNDPFAKADSNLSSDVDEYSDDEEIKGDYLESTTKNFKKLRKKTLPIQKESRTSAFSLKSFGDMLTSKVKTIRNYKSKNKDEQNIRHPVYFRYFRINEIGVSLTYKHSESSWLNTKNLRIIIKPFIKHGKFITMAKMLDKYESFCK